MLSNGAAKIDEDEPIIGEDTPLISGQKAVVESRIREVRDVEAEVEAIQGGSPLQRRGRIRQEAIFALFNRYPFLEAFNDGMALHFSIEQIFTLYPQVKIGPYLVIGDLVGGGLGLLIGGKLLRDARKVPNTPIRIARATTDGLTIYLFAMTDVIRSFLDIHPKEAYISSAKFWGELAIFPDISLLSYATWYSISPSAKERWFPSGSRQGYVKNTLDWALTFLYSSRVLQETFIRFFNMPHHLPYQLVSVVPAGIIATVQNHSRFGQAMLGFTNALTAVNFVDMFKESLVPKNQEHIGEPEELGYFRVAFWLLMLLVGTALAAKYAKSFLRNYKEERAVLSNGSTEQAINAEKLGCLSWMYEKTRRKPRRQEAPKSSTSPRIRLSPEPAGKKK